MTQPASPSAPSGLAPTTTNEGDRSRATKTRQVHPLPTLTRRAGSAVPLLTTADSAGIPTGGQRRGLCAVPTSERLKFPAEYHVPLSARHHRRRSIFLHGCAR